MQRSRAEAPCAPLPPILQASGKQPQWAKQFLKAVQAQAQEVKPKAKQAPKPKFKPSGAESKKRKKVLVPDDSGDESSPIPCGGSEDGEDSLHPGKPSPTKKSKVKQKRKKPLRKTKKGHGVPRETKSVSAADKIAGQLLEEEAPATQDERPTPQDKDVSEKVCVSTGSCDGSTVSTALFCRFLLRLNRFPRIALCHL